MWLQDASRRSFIEGLRKLRSLRRLCLPYVANDQIIQGLAKSCLELRYLDIAGASEVTENGLKALFDSALASNLQYVNLGGPGGQPQSIEVVADLLLALQNLLSIGGYPFTGKALIKAGEKHGGQWKSNLR